MMSNKKRRKIKRSKLYHFRTIPKSTWLERGKKWYVPNIHF